MLMKSVCIQPFNQRVRWRKKAGMATGMSSSVSESKVATL